MRGKETVWGLVSFVDSRADWAWSTQKWLVHGFSLSILDCHCALNVCVLSVLDGSWVGLRSICRVWWRSLCSLSFKLFFELRHLGHWWQGTLLNTWTCNYLLRNTLKWLFTRIFKILAHLIRVPSRGKLLWTHRITRRSGDWDIRSWVVCLWLVEFNLNIIYFWLLHNLRWLLTRWESLERICSV